MEMRNPRSGPTRRQALRNFPVAGTLAAICAYALMRFVERHTAVPRCLAHGATHGLTLKGFDYPARLRNGCTSVCGFAHPDGNEQPVRMSSLVPFYRDPWINFALEFEFTVCVFFVLIGLLWVALDRLLTAAARPHGVRDAP